jgi:hypothetical protein
MSDREYFARRAVVEREAALKARDLSSFRAHMDMAREYEWRAATEPFPEVPMSRVLQR